MTAPTVDRYRAAAARSPGATTSSASCSRGGRRKISSSSTLAAREGAPTFVFFEGPPTANGRPGHPSRLLAHDQGSLLPPSRDEGVPRAAQGGLGHARPAGRDRGREAARHQRQAADRGARRGRVQPALPRERVQVPRRLGEAERAHRLLARLRRTRTSRTRTTTSRACGGRSRRCFDKKPAVSRAQDPAVLPALRDGAVEPRGRAGYEDVEDPSVYIALELGGAGADPTPGSSCGRPRRGRSCRTRRSRCTPISTTSSSRKKKGRKGFPLLSSSA